MTSALANDADHDAVVVRFTCRELDEECLQTTELYDLAQKSTSHSLHLDLSTVETISCGALTRLMVVSRGLLAAGKTVCLMHVQPEVYKTLLANNVTGLFDMSLAAP
jgi:anti-anti-sigma regulatory factor